LSPHAILYASKPNINPPMIAITHGLYYGSESHLGQEDTSQIAFSLEHVAQSQRGRLFHASMRGF
jgi:hypothetical protein